MITSRVGVGLGILAAFGYTAAAQDRVLNVLSVWEDHPDRWVERQDGGYMLYRRLNERAFELLRRRATEVAKLRTAADWESRRERVRRILNETLGPWPARTPLNARTTGTIRRTAYRVEKVVFESMPGFHVTAALYIPEGPATKRAGVLVIPGHTMDALRAAYCQSMALNLVHKGFVVLVYDPIGQGERQQEIDPATGKQLVDQKALPFYKYHSYPGNQCFLSGVSIARYFVWDAMRAIDYLVSRREVDAERIGVIGNSGGGNLTVFTGALDDRVKVAVPSCWLTSRRRLLEVNGIQDAENNIYRELQNGIEHADWLLARAPKPTLVLATSHDHYPIQGVRETAAEMRRIYQALGAAADFGLSEDDGGHGYTPKNIEASNAFLMKHLGVAADPSERAYPLLKKEELKVTITGQVVTEFKAETVFSVNARETAGLLKRLENSRQKSGHILNVLRESRRLSGYRGPVTPHEAVYRGGFRRDGYRLEKWALDGGPNAVIPLLLAIPKGEGPFPAVIYLSPDGKTTAATPGGTLEKLVRRGFAVAAADVIGIGETQPRIGRQNDTNAAFYIGALIGGSTVGLQAEDVTAVASWLRSDGRIRAGGAGLLASGAMGPAATHAAAFDPNIRWLVLDRAPASYSAVAMHQVYTVPSAALVPGALTAYDLPDLLASLAPRRVAAVTPVDQAQEVLGQAAASEHFRYTVSHYRTRGAGANFRIPTQAEEGLVEAVVWGAQ
jgi:dienelactone hydrolase